jgi:putative hydrolase of HD superfamily
MIEKFFEKVLELKNVPRQGWKEKLEIDNPESVADHSYSTTVLSMILSDMKGLDSITESYFEIWNDYQKKISKEAILLHDIDKLEMAFQAKFYQKNGISKEKLKTFFDTAKIEIKDKNLRDILSNIIE